MLDDRVKLAEAAHALKGGDPVQRAKVALEREGEAQEASFELTTACANAGLVY
jgi:hypothetical protein